MKFGVIVEGHAEVSAVPALIRKVASDLNFNNEIVIPKPFRLPRGKIVKEEEIKRAAFFMGRKTDPDGVVLVVFDADDDCPAILGPQVLAWVREVCPHRRTIVVIANREFESWFIAAADAFNGERGLRDQIQVPENHEAIRDAKGWMSNNMVSGYSPTLDQANFSANIDTTAARRNDSFDKLMRELTPLFI